MWIWDVETGKVLHTLAAHDGRAVAVAFNRDGSRLATGGQDGLVGVWDVTGGKRLRTLTRDAGEVADVEIHPQRT